MLCTRNRPNERASGNEWASSSSSSWHFHQKFKTLKNDAGPIVCIGNTRYQLKVFWASSRVRGLRQPKAQIPEKMINWMQIMIKIEMCPTRTKMRVNRNSSQRPAFRFGRRLSHFRMSKRSLPCCAYKCIWQLTTTLALTDDDDQPAVQKWKEEEQRKTIPLKIANARARTLGG